MAAPVAPIRWGILGTGSIGRLFAQELAETRTGRLAAVGSRSQSSADAFARELNVPRAHGSYEALLSDPEVDAVYVSTLHPLHHGGCLYAAENGKHLLCEKPVTMCLREAEAVARAVRERGVFFMEAFMYRCHPQTARLVELIRDGAIGDVRLIEAFFCFQAAPNPAGRLFDKTLGGGGILDVGCYPVSIARLVAGAAQGKPFANPTRLQGGAVFHPQTGADIYAAATAEFPGGILAQLTCGISLPIGMGLRVHGSAGSIYVPKPFVVPRDGARIELRRHDDKEAEIISVPAARPLYAIEADAVGDAILAGRTECDAMTIDDSLGNMTALDRWRNSVGLTYASDLPIPSGNGLP